MDKSSLRQQMSSVLRNFCVDKNARDIASQSACDIFLSAEFYKNAGLICAFCSMANEIETLPIIERALVDGKSVAVPRVVPDTSDMDFYILKNDCPISTQLISGEFGILEPNVDLEKLDVRQVENRFSQNVVFLVPGLAFDESGERLGKGKGFYDKYFTRVTDFLRVGFCFPFQMVEKVPCDLHDIRMTHIISDKIITCS